MSRLTILILHDKAWRNIAQIVLPIIQNYCDRWKFGLFVKEYDNWESDAGYEKLAETRKLFESGSGIVWNLDLDCLITNHTINVKDCFDDYHDLFICNYPNGINAGSFALRKSDWSEYFIDFALDQRGKERMYCEQDAMSHYIRTIKDDPQICFLPHPTINSIKYELYKEYPEGIGSDGDWKPEHLLLHLPGLGVNERINILKNTPILK